MLPLAGHEVALLKYCFLTDEPSLTTKGLPLLGHAYATELTAAQLYPYRHAVVRLLLQPLYADERALRYQHDKTISMRSSSYVGGRSAVHASASFSIIYVAMGCVFHSP